MLRLISVSMNLLLAVALLEGSALSQESSSTVARKVVNQVAPSYPQLAAKLNLSGNVKLLVTVAPNGSVKSVEVRGGHPVLVPEAQTAIYKWKWVPAKDESQETVEMQFHPR